ncbi:hypothetical protein TRFO_29293 [Tritrichomonas foetus]|uniref:Spindle assembly abnormal protein 6 N-terminal domain-containing protein n=1 Tax=Tritrichomonas foetus TaxID=1144522 RepID=A0A1J4K1G5_9EUKA|nr:hypothetical protein TRFO_29293 [Tritrichomonas foetus]|eukprot:OHT03317.1 hypothetical protein TRFO_29293 [Tritrichomonas foetus]
MSDEGSYYDIDVTEFQHPIQAEGFEKNYEEDLVVSVDDADELIHFILASNPQTNRVRLEISKEADIYWVGQFEISQEEFPEFAKTQPIKKVKYESFVPNLVKVLENVRTNRSAFSAVLTVEDDSFVLTFRQQLEFKRVEIYRITLNYLSNDFPYTQDQAQFRYSLKLAQYEDAVQRLNDLFDHVESKNPQLCAQLRKGSKFVQK